MRKVEEAELQRLENLKNHYISEMMGKCNIINDCIKEVKNGTWYQRMKNISTVIERVKENGAEESVRNI